MPDLSPSIPDYTLLRPVGRGAYGEVWLARSVTGVHRAVKIIRRASFTEDRPFDREFAEDKADFDRAFNNTTKLIKGWFIVCVILSVLALAAIVTVGLLLLGYFNVI